MFQSISIFAFLQAAGQSNSMYSLLFILGIFAIMYFFMIRPQAKRAKQQQNFQESLEKGSKVVTMGGIHGKIIKVGDQTIQLEIANDTRIKVERSVISAEMTNLAYAAPAAEEQ